MSFSIIDAAGYDRNDPVIIAAGEDFDEYANLISALYQARKSQGITQKDVAERMGTKQSAVSDIEAIGGNPTVRTLLRYSRAIGMRLRLRALTAQSPAVWTSTGTFTPATVTMHPITKVDVSGEWRAA